MDKCPKCGKKLKSNAKFCTACGYSIENKETKNNKNNNIKTNNNINKTLIIKSYNFLNSFKLLKLAKKNKCFNY